MVRVNAGAHPLRPNSSHHMTTPADTCQMVRETTSVRRGIAMAVVTASLWGILAIGLKAALGFSDAPTVVWFRFTTAFSLLLMWRAAKEGREGLSILWRPPLIGIIAGAALGLNYFGYTRGVGLTSAGNTQIIIQVGPILLAVSGVVLFGERLRPRQLVGFLVTAAGFALFFQEQLSQLVAAEGTYWRGNLWIVVAAVSWCGFAILQKILTKTVAPASANMLLYLTAAICFFPLATPASIASWSFEQWCVMIYLALNTVFAYGALGEALKHAPATAVSVIITVNPVITFVVLESLAALQVTWVEPETMGWSGYVGAAVALGGVMLVAIVPSPSRTQHRAPRSPSIASA